ncbi:hypothetical protein QTN25_008908 [Entamoeba marina]
MSFLNLLKQQSNLADFFSTPYVKYQNIFDDFTIHKPFIDALSQNDIFAIPEPKSTDLIALFPISQTVYYHMVTAVTTCPSLNQLLLNLVPRHMNEMVFWYKYFVFLFTKEDYPQILPSLIERRCNMNLTTVAKTMRDVYINHFTNRMIGNPTILLMKFIQLINDSTQNKIDKTFYNYTNRFDGLPKDQSDLKYRYQFVLMVLNEIFKNCKLLYIPYVGNLLLEMLQLYDINNTFLKILNFIVHSQCEGLYFTTQYELENCSYNIYYILLKTYPELQEKPRTSILNFLSSSLKNLTLKLFESLPITEKRPYIEFLLDKGKIGVLKIYISLFKPLSTFDFDNLVPSIQSNLNQILSVPNDQHEFFSRLTHHDIDPLLCMNHFHNTLELPNNDDKSNNIVLENKLESLSDIISTSDFIQLYKMLPKRLQMLYPIKLYTSSQDGLNLQTLYDRVSAHSLLLILCKRSSCVFGIFVAEQFEIKRDYYGNSETFIFTIKPTFKKYPHIQGSNHFLICSKQDALLFGGGTGHPSIGFDTWLNCESYSSPTFDNPAFFTSKAARRCDRVEVLSFS